MHRLACVLIAVAALVVVARPIAASQFEAADKLCAAQRFHEALALVKKAILEFPDSPTGFGIQAKIQFHLSMFADCRASLQKARNLGGESWDEFNAPFLARLDFWKGDDALARAHLEKVRPDEFVAKGLPILLDKAAEMESKRTPHFIVYVDKTLAKKGALKPLSSAVENCFEVYSKIFRFKGEPIINRVYCFGKADEWMAFASNFGSNATPDSSGYYSRNYRTIFVNVDPGLGRPLSDGVTDSALHSIYKEGFEQFCDMYCPGLPIWYELGVGNYVSQSEFVDGKPKLGTYRRKDEGSTITTRYERLKQALKDESFLPLSALLTMDEKEFRDRTDGREHINNAHAWSFVHFLLHDKKFSEGKKLLTQFFMDMRSGLTKEEAFARGFGRLDLKKVEGKWKEFALSM